MKERNFVSEGLFIMSDTTVKEKQKELSSLLKEQEDEELLDVLLSILKDKDKKEISVILRAICADKGTPSAFYKVITEMGKAVEEEHEKEDAVGYTPDGKPLKEADVRARVKAASRRVKEGDYTTQEDMEKKEPGR